MDWFSSLFLWILIPLLNFGFWNYIAFNYSTDGIPPPLICPLIHHHNIRPMESGPLQFNYSSCLDNYHSLKNLVASQRSQQQRQQILSEQYALKLTPMNALLFEQFKGDELAKVKSPNPVTIISKPDDQPCNTYAEVTSSVKMSVKSCVAVAWTHTQQHTQYLQRYNLDAKKTGRALNFSAPKTSGIFRNVAKKKGRMALAEKLNPLLKHLDDIERTWVQILAARGIHAGDDIVLMVVNDGEFDLYLNFACSCRAHGIPLHNVVVVCASA
jgi:hypothetical protein